MTTNTPATINEILKRLAELEARVKELEK